MQSGSAPTLSGLAAIDVNQPRLPEQRPAHQWGELKVCRHWAGGKVKPHP